MQVCKKSKLTNNKTIELHSLNNLQNKENRPLITVGVITHNAQDTVERSLESILNQTWENTEIIIVDDASTDSTVKILKKYSQKDPRVTIHLNQKNYGVAYNRQKIVDLARGVFLAFQDDDDFSFNTRLETQYQRLTTYINVNKTSDVICYGDRITIDNSRTKTYIKGIGRQDPAPHGHVVLKSLIGRKHHPDYSWGKMGAGTMMVATQILKKLQFDARFRRAAEIDLSIRAAAQDFHFISVAQPVIEQYITDSIDKTPWVQAHYQTLTLFKNYKLIKDNKISFFMIIRYIAYILSSLVSGLKALLLKNNFFALHG